MTALLRGGAAVDMVDRDGETALMRAAGYGHYECVRLLLEAGADATVRATDGGWEGENALSLMQEWDKAEVAALLRGWGHQDE